MDEQLDARGKPRSAYQTVNTLPSKTAKSEADQANIQTILRKYKELGIVDHLNLTEAMFPDVTEIGDFADVVRTAKAAEVEFMKMPSKIREIFNHDVATWLDYAHDEEKRASLLAEGKIQPVEQPTAGHPGDNPSRDGAEGNANPPAK